MSLNSYIRKSMKLRRSGCFWQAQDMYPTIFEKLKQEIANAKNAKTKRKFQTLYGDYVIRLQHLEFEIDYNGFQSLGQIKESVRVLDADFDLRALLGRYADEQVKEVIVFRRKFLNMVELNSLHNLAEILDSVCPNLQYVKLKCHRDGADDESEAAIAQQKMFKEFENNWVLENVKLSIQVVDNGFLDSHKIVFSNGHVFLFERYDLTVDGTKESGFKISVWSTEVLQKYIEGY